LLVEVNLINAKFKVLSCVHSRGFIAFHNIVESCEQIQLMWLQLRSHCT